MKTVESKQYSLGWRDVAKALLVAILTPVLLVIQTSLDQGHLELNWKNIGIAAVSGAIAYLIKNFFTPTQTVVKAPADAIEIKKKDAEITETQGS